MIAANDKTSFNSILCSLMGRGFSLIELALVIVIVGILAATAAPKFATISVFSQRTYFDEVLGSIRYAQKIAVGMGCEVQVSLTSTSLSLNLRANCRSGNFTQGVRDPANGNTTYTKLAPNGVTLDSTTFPIYFDRLGRAHNPAGVVANTSLTVNSQSITVVGETGYAYGG